MPYPGQIWRHVIVSTRRSWLHGDGRGFRARGHRIHSSGDYKHPPSAGEHAGLLRYHRGRALGEPVKIPWELCEELGRAILGRIVADGFRVLVLAVSGKHCHVLVELPVDPAKTRRIVGKWKTVRTPAVRAALPGTIWGEGGKYKPVLDRGHQVNAFRYIRDDQGEGAWVWTCNGSKTRAKKNRGKKRK